jgi:CTP:molybdopterin cytidylyltransferase MocA
MSDQRGLSSSRRSRSTSVSAVVLAAGAAQRFGAPKQRILLPEVLARVRASKVDDVLVVVGAHEVETEARTVHCPEWERGPGASLRCGLRATPPEAIAAVVVLADGPNLASAAIDRLLAEWNGEAEILAASYDGDRGHPVLVPRALFGRIPDDGARALPAKLVPCEDLGPPGDVDTVADLPGTPDPLERED